MSFVFNKHRRWLGSAGVTSLEFALVLVPFLWMTFATVDIGRYLFTAQAMVALMAEAERFAVIDPTDALAVCGSWSKTATITPLLDPTLTTVCISSTSNSPLFGGGSVNQVQVKVTYNSFTAVTPGLGALDATSSNPMTQMATISYMAPPPPQ